MDTLDNILNDEEVAEAVEQPEVVEAETPTQPRDDQGRFAPRGETESVSPTPVEEPAFDHQAVIGERRRRQEAEARLAEMEQRLQALQEPPQPAPDMFENPEGWQQHLRGDVVSAAVQQATLNAKLDMSEMMVRQARPDFDDMKQTFLQLAQDNPVLAQQALADPHPWDKAYQIAQNHKTMQELGAANVAELEAKLREKIQAEMTQAAPAPVLPTSLADAQSARGGIATQPARLSLDEILNGR